MRSYAILLTLASGLAMAQDAAQDANVRQDPEAMRTTVAHYLETQSAGLPGRVEVRVGPVDSRLNAPACAAMEAFLPPGARPWGKTTVGVRCTAPSPWLRYVTAQVSVYGTYLITAAPLAQNQAVGPNDVAKMTGDLTALPAGILTDVNAAVGRTAAMSLAAGTPLRRDALRSLPAVQQGQLVKLTSRGPGFSASTEARAITNAVEGGVAQVRTASGSVVSGIARLGGVVEVAY